MEATAQLNLFDAPIRKMTPAYHLNDELIGEVRTYTRRVKALNTLLRANKEYVAFTKKIIKVASSLGETNIEIRRALRERTFKVKANLAKNELVEMKSWLELLDSGSLLKGNYLLYMNELSACIELVRKIIKKFN